jgi:hypothetical protein
VETYDKERDFAAGEERKKQVKVKKKLGEYWGKRFLVENMFWNTDEQ